MDLGNSFYHSQLEAIQEYYDSLSDEEQQAISLTEAIITWFTEGHAEKFRQEYLRMHEVVA
ncbi:MAG: hypothetical protein ACRBF0_01935 [Calditrichia bacterium]